MRISVVASGRAAALRWADAAHPVHLPDDLAAALTDAGHEAVVHRLPDAEDAEHAYMSVAPAGQWLAEHAGSGLLHAVDPVAATACLAARSATGTPVAVRWGPLPEAPTVTERRLRQACLRAADVVVAPSEYSARQAGAGGAADVRVVPDGVDVEKLGGAVSEPPAALRRLVTLSGAAAGGTLSAVRALRSLPGTELVVVGLGTDGRVNDEADAGANALRREVEQCGVAGRVLLAGWRPRTDALEELTQASVVLCLRSGPTSATSALEAMSRARPVVGWDTPLLDDIVAHRTTGALVRPGDDAALASALTSLLEDPFTREAWGQAGRDRVGARYDWGRVVPALEGLYELLGRAGATV